MRYRHAGHRRLTIASALSFLLLLTPLLLSAGWEELSPFPVGATDGAVSFTIGDTAYVAGGVGNSRILAWDSASGWRVAASFPDGQFRAWSFVLVHDGVAIIGGGDSTGGFTVTDQVFEFNPGTGGLTEKNPFASGPRDGTWSFVIGDRGYVGGGFDGEYVIPDMWEYNFEEDSWRQLPQPPLPALIFASSFTVDGKGYVVGGGISFSGSNQLYEFNPQTGAWNLRAEFPGAPRQAGVAYSWRGKGYYGLGMRSYDTTYADIWEYNPATDTWSSHRDDFPDFRSAWSTAFLLGDDLFVGTGAGFSDASLVFSREFYRVDLTADISSVGERRNYVERLDIE